MDPISTSFAMSLIASLIDEQGNPVPNPIQLGCPDLFESLGLPYETPEVPAENRNEGWKKAVEIFKEYKYVPIIAQNVIAYSKQDAFVTPFLKNIKVIPITIYASLTDEYSWGRETRIDWPTEHYKYKRYFICPWRVLPLFEEEISILKEDRYKGHDFIFVMDGSMHPYDLRSTKQEIEIVRFGGTPGASYPVSQYIPAKALTSSQRKMVEIIEEEAEDADVPPEVCMAMIANARAESNFDPNAYKMESTGYSSVGLFQLHGAPHAAGAGMSEEERRDPVTNTRTIIRELQSMGSMGKWSKPSYAAEHPLTAWERGVRDVAHLTAMFMCFVERPEYHVENDELRRGYAKKYFPDFVARTSVPSRGSPLPEPDTAAGESSSDPWYSQAYDWLFGPETPSISTATWTCDNSDVGLKGSSGTVKQGTVPAGTYTLLWQGRPAAQTIRLASGKDYEIVIEGGKAKVREV